MSSDCARTSGAQGFSALERRLLGSRNFPRYSLARSRTIVSFARRGNFEIAYNLIDSGFVTGVSLSLHSIPTSESGTRVSIFPDPLLSAESMKLITLRPIFENSLPNMFDRLLSSDCPSLSFPTHQQEFNLERVSFHFG